MATPTATSTPPPPSSIRTPPTPRHGWDDNYQPYTPRKSARVSSRAQRAAQTPPPQSNSRAGARSPSTAKKLSAHGAPASPPSTGRRHNSKTTTARRNRAISGSLTEETMASAADSLGLSGKRSHLAASNTEIDGMLPTPAKTPVKRPTKDAPAITHIARNLFPVRPETVEEVMPSPKKGRKKYTGLTMESFTVEEESAPIQIYTDSQDRIPEIDFSEDNPFYGDAVPAAIPEPTKRSSKRRKVTIPGEGQVTVEEAGKRDDGMVYVFRGKKIFRKFKDGDEETSNLGDASGEIIEDEMDETVPTRLRGPLTRSSVKPKLLFPTSAQIAAKEQKAHTTDDEEAVTDIDESINEKSTPVRKIVPDTPQAPKFGPASPPTTMRATRHGKKTGSPSGSEGIRSAGSVSPFNEWRRIKHGVQGRKVIDGAGKKSVVPSKRPRGQAV